MKTEPFEKQTSAGSLSEFCPPVSRAPLFNSLKANQAQILIQNDTGILLYDPAAGIYLANPKNDRIARGFLDAVRRHLILNHQDPASSENGALCLWLNAAHVFWIKKEKDIEIFGECVEYVWTDPQKQPEEMSHLQFRTAVPDDFSMIRAHYDLAGDDELKKIISDGHLFLGVDENGAIVGFAGIHPEGSMGLLEVFPEFQKRGYGLALEAHVILLMQKLGLIPCCDIFLDNRASMALQEKLGLRRCEDHVLWTFIKAASGKDKEGKTKESEKPEDESGTFDQNEY